MSSGVIRGESWFTLSTNRNSALCFSSSAEFSRSRSTPQTSSSSAQQFRRNCGVGLQSKRTIVAVRGVRGDQLADPGAERAPVRAESPA